MTDLVLLHHNEPMTTSLAIAEGVGMEHKSVLQLIRSHVDSLAKFGGVAFEMRPFDTAGGEQWRDVYFLNEAQATLLITFMRNSEIVIAFKVALVMGFFQMRAKLGDRAAPTVLISNPAHEADRLVSADRIFRAGMRSGRVAGLRLSTALARANRMAVAHTGVDILAAMEVDSAQVATEEPAEDYGIGDFIEAWSAGALPVPYTLARSSEFYRAYLCWCADNDTGPALISRFFVICHRAAPWLDKRHVSERRNDAVVRVRAVIPQGVRAGVAEGEWLNHASRELTRFASALAEWEGA